MDFSDALAEAATAAGRAPSIHNTQPWRWLLREDAADLYAERSRQLEAADPDSRLLVISCGAALHHARLALAAHGWRPEVALLPEPQNRDYLARLWATGPAEPEPELLRQWHAVDRRHTDRRTLADVPVPPEALDALRAAAEAEQVHLHLVRDDQMADLSVALAHADEMTIDDPAQRAETAQWVGGDRPSGLGVPDSAVPHAAPRTNVPGRDFGRHGSLEAGAGHDRFAVYAVLFGTEDTPVGWLRGGQALSAVWLTAVDRGLSVVPLSSAVEITSTREQIRGMLAGIGNPYLTLRIGIAAGDGHPGGAGRQPGATERLPAAETVHRTIDE
jgi:nitroreductase